MACCEEGMGCGEGVYRAAICSQLLFRGPWPGAWQVGTLLCRPWLPHVCAPAMLGTAYRVFLQMV